ncbi:MAG TPA: hypothetical protein PKB06_12765 [Actinotalea sp.]|nr:hypothetical protein [Actinotalea sp.]
MEQDLAGSLAGLEARIDAPSLAKAWLTAYQDRLDLRLAGALVMLTRLGGLTADTVDGTLDVATRFLQSATWLTD